MMRIASFIAVTFALGLGVRAFHMGVQYIDKKVLG